MASTGIESPRFIKDEFGAFLERGIVAQGYLRLRCGECGHDKLLGFGCLDELPFAMLVLGDDRLVERTVIANATP